MITTAVYGLSLFAPAISQAQTCKPAPDCADMGYDKSEADCAGKKMLKCPFNTNFVSCEDGSDNLSIFDLVWEELEIIESGDSRISTVNYCNGSSYNCDLDGNTFTFHTDGCLVGEVSGNNSIHSYYINGIEVRKNPDSQYNIFTLPLCFSKGTKLGVDSSIEQIVFVPAKSSMKPLSECEVGDFYLSNNKCSKFSTASQLDIQGVIVDTENKLMINNRLENVLWLTSYYDMITPNYTSVDDAVSDFKGHTYFTKETQQQNLIDGIPFDRCKNYYTDSFVPPAGYINRIIPNYDIIASSLAQININLQNIWTATEYDVYRMWTFNTQTKQFEYKVKSDNHGAICMRHYDEVVSSSEPCFGYNIPEQASRLDICSYDSCTTGSSTFYKLISCNCSSYYPSPSSSYCLIYGGTTCPTDKTLCSTNCCPYTCDEVTCNNLGGWYVDGHCSEEC